MPGSLLGSGVLLGPVEVAQLTVAEAKRTMGSPVPSAGAQQA